MIQSDLILTIGPSGSGKSTWAREYVSKNPDVVYISSDEIRKELTGDMANQSMNGLVFKRVYQKAEIALRKGSSVLIDATNIKKRDRADKVELGKRLGAKLIAHVFKADKQTLINRVQKRASEGGLSVPLEVINKHVDQFQSPDNTEFDEIVNH